MKSIQVTDGTHKRIMELKMYPMKAANDVIEKLINVHHSEQWKQELRVFCFEYEYTDPKTNDTSIKVVHSLGKDADEAESTISRSHFQYGKSVLLKSSPVDILYCGTAFAITPIEQIR